MKEKLYTLNHDKIFFAFWNVIVLMCLKFVIEIGALDVLYTIGFLRPNSESI